MTDKRLTTKEVNQNYYSAMEAGSFVASCLDEAIGWQQETAWSSLGGIKVKASEIDPKLGSENSLSIRLKTCDRSNRYTGFSFYWCISGKDTNRAILFGDGLTHDRLLKKLNNVLSEFEANILAAQRHRRVIQQQKRKREETKQAFTQRLNTPCFAPHQASFSERYVDLELKQLSPVLAADILNLIRQWDNEIITAGEHTYTRRSLQVYADSIHRELGGEETSTTA